MRFKKLKISVAIALIVFALIIANTIAFGLLQTKDSNLATTIDSGKKSSVETNVSSQTSVNQPSQTSDATSVVVNHQMMRTRAS